MYDEYCYYLIDYNKDGFLLQYYSTVEGWLETVDSCLFTDTVKLNRWHDEFGVEVPDSGTVSFLFPPSRSPKGARGKQK